MSKPIDEKILELAEKNYWTEVQFTKGTLRKFVFAYSPSDYAKQRFNQREFSLGDVVIVLQDDECGVANDVECMTRYGLLKIRRTVLAQYTQDEK